MQSPALLLRTAPAIAVTTPMGILNDHSDVKMPESPVDQALSKSSSQPSSLVGPNMSAHPRSHSTSSSTGSIVNGLHSPRSMNGTPSPPSGLGVGAGGMVSAIQGIPANQEVPAACGARQLSKLKRFLTTLQQFGSDISPEIGERVRGLVMGLVNNALTVEEFHNKLQEATNFPLRPFVIPFLKANLPLLQRELMHCARLAKLSPQQYYVQHEHQLLEPKASSVVDPVEHLMEVNENGKRKTPEERMMARPKENGSSGGGERVGDNPHPKRHCSMGSPTHPSPGYPPLNHFPQPSAAHHAFRIEAELGMPPQGGGARDPRDLREMREMREMRERFERERERDRHTPQAAFPPFREVYADPILFEDRMEEDWKHVETMLQCIIGMVEKTKRALSVLRQRSLQDREELAHWNRRAGAGEAAAGGAKKHGEEMVAQTLRQTEDRVSEVKRRAEEAVNEVKRQAVSELQKAVTAAERKANEMVSAERSKLDRAIVEARQQASDEAMILLNHQDDSSENCWNCGRKANETCSGCNTARYCGAFCQHKDWESHHRMCSQLAASSSSSSSSGHTPGQFPPTSGSSSSARPPSHPPATTTAVSPSPALGAAVSAASTVMPASVPVPASATSPTGSHHSVASNRSGSPSGVSSSAPAPPAAVSQES